MKAQPTFVARRMEVSLWFWKRHSSGPRDSGQSWTSALGRVLTVVERLLCDSRYGKLRAGKLPFIRDGARFGWSGSESAGEGS